MDRLRADILIYHACLRIQIASYRDQRATRLEGEKMSSKFEAAIDEFEKLELGFDHHGENLMDRMAGTASRLDDVAKKAHAGLDAKNKRIDAMDAMVTRLDKAVSNGAPGEKKTDPTKGSSTASSTGSANSTSSSGNSGASASTQQDAQQSGDGAKLGEPHASWVNGQPPQAS